ncbi:MAG: MFS transporter [Lachnospiraceae bacterium]|nr:MFS transporter [Lachnospiraceae bacterium]
MKLILNVLGVFVILLLMWLLLAGRVIQGAGTGIALPLMFNIILEQVPEKNMGFMMGVATLITAMAPAVGPSFGRIVATAYGWRTIFAVLVPILLIAFGFGMFGIRQASKVERTSFPIRNWMLLAVSFFGIVFAAGLLFLPGCAIGAALSPISGRIMDRFGAKIPILTGDILIFTSACCFWSFAGRLNAATYIGFYLLFTVGQAFAVGPSMTCGLKHLPEELNTDGNAMINTMQQLAGGRKLWKLVCVLACLLAFSRLYLYEHYPTDILGGIVVGIAVGYAGYRAVP